jgi:hypothetical protein
MQQRVVRNASLIWSLYAHSYTEVDVCVEVKAVG